MKKTFGMIFMIFATVGLMALSGCHSNMINSDSKKYEVFSEADIDLFSQEQFAININGHTCRLGMTKDEIEEVLGEAGVGFHYEGRSVDDAYISGSLSENSEVPSSYGGAYKTLSNYFYYPQNKVAVVYRSVENKVETTNQATLISVGNSNYKDAYGFSVGGSPVENVESYLIETYGKENIDEYDWNELYFDSLGNYVSSNYYITHYDSPGVWIVYHSNKDGYITSINYGCHKSTDEKRVYKLWQ